MLQIGFSLGSARNRVALCHGAAAKPLQLRKDEPHPVRTFAPAAQFCQRLRILELLRIDEALQVVGIGHGSDCGMKGLRAICNSPASTAIADGRTVALLGSGL